MTPLQRELAIAIPAGIACAVGLWAFLVLIVAFVPVPA